MIRTCTTLFVLVTLSLVYAIVAALVDIDLLTPFCSR